MRNRGDIGILAVIVAAGIVVSGCQARPGIEFDPALNTANAGTVYVYRPSSQWAGLAIDYRVTLDGDYIGSLKTGKYIQAFAPPGDHVITVQPHFFTIPDGKPGTVTITAEAGESYYVRFSQHLDSIIVAGGSGLALGHLELNLVPYETWERRL